MTLPENAQLLEQCIKQVGTMLCKAVMAKNMDLAREFEALQGNLVKARAPSTVVAMEAARGIA
jgi:hypothetical protein